MTCSPSADGTVDGELATAIAGLEQPDRAWFDRPPLDVAHGLLGAVLVSRSPGGDVALRVTETEAYHGSHDPGSHAYRGRSARNEVMFRDGGHLYVYRHLGLHTCMNVVTGQAGEASAVLLRAGEIVVGQDLAHGRRTAVGVVRSPVQLASGPARLTVALAVTMDDAGTNLLDPASRLRLFVPGVPVQSYASGPRVGVGGAGAGPGFDWRRWIPGDPTVSAFRPGVTRRRGKQAD
jgi:DNA-3-methyladenine glycosylase